MARKPETSKESKEVTLLGKTMSTNQKVRGNNRGPD